MKIIFLNRNNPNDINAWSGTFNHILQKLKEKHTVEILGMDILKQIDAFKQEYASEKNDFHFDRYHQIINNLLSERINRLKFDVVFMGDLLFSSLKINIPYINLSDTSYQQNCIFAKNKNEQNQKFYLSYERSVLNNSFRILHSSEWIKSKVIDYYKIEAKKIKVVEFGANIPTPKNYSIDIDTNICRLVFIGKNWEGKGGDKLLEMFKILKKDGFSCTLTVIGSTPENFQDLDDVTFYPTLNKSKPSDLEKLCMILSESHFLVLPTQFDAFGIVFCEASAYAVPSIAANVGGVSQAVKNGKNGYLLPADATANDYAEKVKSVFNDREGYLKLRRSSRHEFDTRLNWDVWGDKVDKILEEAVDEWKTKK